MSVFETVRRRVVGGVAATVAASGRRSQDLALSNARSACTELSRRRLERAEVEAFLAAARPAPEALGSRGPRRA